MYTMKAANPSRPIIGRAMVDISPHATHAPPQRRYPRLQMPSRRELGTLCLFRPAGQSSVSLRSPRYYECFDIVLYQALGDCHARWTAWVLNGYHDK
jgi:hypothetical protein